MFSGKVWGMLWKGGTMLLGRSYLNFNNPIDIKQTHNNLHNLPYTHTPCETSTTKKEYKNIHRPSKVSFGPYATPVSPLSPTMLGSH